MELRYLLYARSHKEIRGRSMLVGLRPVEITYHYVLLFIIEKKNNTYLQSLEAFGNFFHVRTMFVLLLVIIFL